MFFLFRLAFWVGLVLLLLPFGLKGSDGRDVSVFDAFGAAQALVADLRGFCDRQPQACAVGGQMAGHLVEKAQVGARWVYDSIGHREGAPPAPVPGAQPGAKGTADKSAAEKGSALELTPQDLMPLWGGGDAAKLVVPQGFQPVSGQPAQTMTPTPLPPLPPRRPA
ncbi:hypothetical protein GGQ86_002425 [Xanthobacter flavus]|uniref:DUF5330 domain-containing protein n=1 Tax=Xanthobacter flavus TaxID=281 RepID=A0A9W6FJW0_XANFL|nr:MULTISPECIES: DUF5330 domain-containing protein [Xanthobacter]MCL8385047.1 DUF5330 domain-containing protein [Xanthobacter aminoxidans]MDR6333949.1 hypothetical protein [Xanthobacter flavus]GLI22665.1 hypothetical protein XFLAVUS301_23390 [Xanthobacter flavus]